MPCYKPIDAWQLEDGTVAFVERGRIRRQLVLPCGQCVGCRLERSRQWALRCIHEAREYNDNCFLTLTYDDAHLPENGQLQHRDVQLFIKRLREHAQREQTALLGRNYQGAPAIRTSTRAAANVLATGRNRYTKKNPALYALRASINPRVNIRYYLCGEYGEQTQRPHYHICLFNCDFNDKKHVTTTPAGSKLYQSATLEKLWSLGHSTIGDLTFESAAYTARYVMKKITGDKAKHHYAKLNAETGELYMQTPEYNQMSRGTGIGKTAFQKYNKDWYPEGQCVVRGHKTTTPRYYDKLYKKLDEHEYSLLLSDRAIAAEPFRLDNTDERRAVKEQVTRAKLGFLKRT